MVALTVRAAQVSRKSARRRIGKSTNRAGLARSRHVVNGMAIHRASPTANDPDHKFDHRKAISCRAARELAVAHRSFETTER
jgi:hypothetical protein